MSPRKPLTKTGKGKVGEIVDNDPLGVNDDEAPAKGHKGETRTVALAGDNNPDKPVDGKKLLGFIEKLEKVQARVDHEMQEKREVFADAKAIGYDNKTIRKILTERKMDGEKRKEAADLLTLYKSAIGMLDDDE